MPTSASAAERTVVIVELDVPALSGARGLEAESRSLALRTASRRLEARVLQSVPGAQVHWRYRRVLAGFAVSVPRDRAGDLAGLPGVAAVYPSFGYGPLLGQTPAAIGAPVLWGPGLAGSAGRGVKIAVVDDGVDQTHEYFDPGAFTMPPGFPKGKKRYTTAKVIVARSFPSPDALSRDAAKPFDPDVSSHGTHVAGIAAGNPDTLAPGADGSPDVVLSGVAPLAYIGNYRVLTVPTDSGLGPNGNSPEIVAAIEAAVEDGMDVLNLSIGEPEVPPELDVVALALDNAAAAGVIPVVAAGNEFLQLGVGSVHSPGNSARAITVAAARTPRAVVAGFSSGGPTPLGLTMKPDVTAPGVEVLSSIPGSSGPFATISGTSMAAPHVAGAAALLRERHPDWTVAQLKSALVTAARPVFAGAGQTREVPSTRQGGGLVDLPAADHVRIFAEPQGLAFGLVDVSTGAQEVSRTIELADAGEGAGSWEATVVEQNPGGRAHLGAPASVEVPGSLLLTVSAGRRAREGERTGFVVLSRDDERLRIPFWFRVTNPSLTLQKAKSLPGPGTYKSTTAGQPAVVSRYRYPDRSPAFGRQELNGPERLFQLRIGKQVKNFGVAVLAQNADVEVEPRIVQGRDENRLVGETGLPFVANAYLGTFGEILPVAGALRPLPGEYTIVFDSQNRRTSGGFRFHVWVDDVTPPRIALLSRSGTRLTARITDPNGSGVYAESVEYAVDGRDLVSARYEPRKGTATIDLSDVRPGRHRLLIRASDRQETKNTENAGGILPNTRTFTASVTVP